MKWTKFRGTQWVWNEIWSQPGYVDSQLPR